MPSHAKGPRPLGYRAMERVETALIHMSTVRRLSHDVDLASERSNHALVVALTASIRRELDAANAALRDAALGR